jgi:hypothetical protein
MAEKEEEKKVPPESKVTVGGEWDFSQIWKGFYVGKAPPEVEKLLDEVSAFGIEKYYVVSYLLSKFIDEDRLKLAKEVQNWIMDLKFKWMEMKKAQTEKGVKK